jgi:hypothetical protein
MIIRESNRTTGLVLAAMMLWSVTAFGSVQICPVHDAPGSADVVADVSGGAPGHASHAPEDEHGPTDQHGGHDCRCAGHCSPTSGESVSISDSRLSLALLDAGLVTVSVDYAQPSPASHPWLFPPANGPPAV